MIERQVRHLVRLVDDLLDVSRIIRGKIELRKEAVDLAAVVGQAVETARPADRRAPATRLTVSLPDEPVRLEADPTRLAQVFVEPAEQRRQVHRAGRADPAVGRAGGGRGRRPGAGHRHRHRAGRCCPGIFDLFSQVDRALGARRRAGWGSG